MSIIGPSLLRARQLVRRVQCINNLHLLGTGIHCYQSEYGGTLPWEGFAEGDRPIRYLGPWEDTSLWFNAAPEYAGQKAYCKLQQAALSGKGHLPRDGDSGVFVCPESSPAMAGPKDDLVTDGYFMLWGLNTEGTKLDRRKTFWSYAFNTQLDGAVEDRHTGCRTYISNTSIRCLSATVVLSEKLMRPDEFDPLFASSVGQGETSWKEFTTRHDKGGMLLFLDNHVAYFTRQALTSGPNIPEDYNLPGQVVWNPKGYSN
jgi:prepilin-type processing-associated H-X9-DG protein